LELWGVGLGEKWLMERERADEGRRAEERQCL
jgi:hypothetical protein